MANTKEDIQIELQAPKPTLIKYIRLSKKSAVYCESWRQRTYLCSECNAVVVSKTGHAMWHQRQLDLMIAIAYKTIPLDELQKMEFAVTEVNPTIRPSF